MIKANLTILIIQLSSQVFSQSLADTSFLATSIACTKKVYSKFIGGNAHLYSGREYKNYNPVNEEHPYFISDDWAIGSVVYSNEVNENVGVMYDIRNDKVVIENYSNGIKIELVSQAVSGFKVHGHTFVTLKSDSLKQIEEGFYDRLYDGNLKVYARRIKDYEERIEGDVLIPSFNEKDKYFLLKDGKYYPVNSKTSVLDVLVDKKQELKRYLSKSSVRYNKEKETALVKLAGFYDTLKD